MSVLKWCLNHPKQAEFMRGLADLCGIGVQATKYKPLRDRQIQSSEEYVQRIMGDSEWEILESSCCWSWQRWICVQPKFWHAISGKHRRSVGNKKNGKKLYNDFKKQRLHSTKIAFNAKIPKQIPTLFSDTRSKAKWKKDNTSKVIKANRTSLARFWRYLQMHNNQSISRELYHTHSTMCR